MKNKIWIPIIALLLITSVDASAQRWKLRRYELDLYLAGVSFHGDIGLADRPLANMVNGFRPNVGANVRFRVLEGLSANLDLGYVMYGGRDEQGSSHGRYYSFNSHAFQHVVRAEYLVFGGRTSPLSDAIYNRRGMLNSYNQLYIYLFAGGGGVLSKSKVKDLDNEGVEPLSNPGYNNNLVYTAVFPLGVSVKWELDPRWTIGVELGYNFTLSDYLDGYASEFSQYNDSYYLTSVRAIYKIRNDRNGRPILKKLYR